MGHGQVGLITNQNTVIHVNFLQMTAYIGYLHNSHIIYALLLHFEIFYVGPTPKRLYNNLDGIFHMVSVPPFSRKYFVFYCSIYLMLPTLHYHSIQLVFLGDDIPWYDAFFTWYHTKETKWLTELTRGNKLIKKCCGGMIISTQNKKIMHVVEGGGLFHPIHYFTPLQHYFKIL